MNDQDMRTVLWHSLRTFFEDLDEWRKAAAYLGIESKMTREEYDDLLKGTRADVYVPLWASCAKTGTKELCNQVTLEVVRRYKATGYVPSSMDGNPQDYIGQQFRFL
jgi:anaerobic dimethyl sulfoxide reductase subunit A